MSVYFANKSKATLLSKLRKLADTPITVASLLEFELYLVTGSYFGDA